MITGHQGNTNKNHLIPVGKAIIQKSKHKKVGNVREKRSMPRSTYMVPQASLPPK